MKQVRRWLAALLVVVQTLASGAVTLAHARERFSEPAHVEARHSSGCVVLHDELRCALCHFAGAPVLPLVVRHAARDLTLAVRRRATVDPAPRSRSPHLSAPPRAPPVTVS